jgi:O-antigen ligase
MFATVLTFSRAGIAGLLIAVATVAVIERHALRSLATAIGCGLAAAIAIFGAWYDAMLHGYFGLYPLRGAADETGGVGHRTELWRAAVQLWRTSPLSGIGAGNYEFSLDRAGLHGVRTHANSWYLQALAEGGILLLAATLGFIVATLDVLRLRLRESAPWTLAAFAVTLALALHHFVDDLVFYQQVGTPWMLLIGIGAAASVSPRNKI